MKDYLQPTATFALALAIASLGFTLPRDADSCQNSVMRIEFDPRLIHTRKDQNIKALRIAR